MRTMVAVSPRHRTVLPRVPHLPPPAENRLYPPLRTALHAHPRLETNATCAVSRLSTRQQLNPIAWRPPPPPLPRPVSPLRGQVHSTAQPVPPRALSIRTVAITQRSITRATTTTSIDHHDGPQILSGRDRAVLAGETTTSNQGSPRSSRRRRGGQAPPQGQAARRRGQRRRGPRHGRGFSRERQRRGTCFTFKRSF